MTSSDIALRNLSPGDQQLVEIGRALLVDPRIIIFDEPTRPSPVARDSGSLSHRSPQAARGDDHLHHALWTRYSTSARATILRNGETVGAGLIVATRRAKTSCADDRRGQADTYYAHEAAQIGEVALKVSGLGRRGVIQDVSFDCVLAKWLAYGAAWSVGLSWRVPSSARSYHTESRSAPQSRMPERVKPGQVKQYRHDHRNRREEGLLLPLSVKQNMSLNLKALTSIGPFVDSKKRRNGLGVCRAARYHAQQP